MIEIPYTRESVQELLMHSPRTVVWFDSAGSVQERVCILARSRHGNVRTSTRGLKMIQLFDNVSKIQREVLVCNIITVE